MTDPDVQPAAAAAPEPPEQTAELLPPPEPPPSSPRRGALPWISGMGFLLLAGGIFYLWWLTQQVPPIVAVLEQRLAYLEHRASPSPAIPVDLQALEARIEALEHQASPDLAALKAQIAALENRQPADLAPLQAQIAALQQAQASLAPLQERVAAVEKQAVETGPVAARLDALAAQLQALSVRDQAAEADLARRLDAAETRLTALEHTAAQMTTATRQAALLARIEVAQAALAAGHPLGMMEGAPPAVARFAATAPPTEADLRLAFPKAAEAALAAASPHTGGKTFLAQMLTRAEDLVTVRQGDRVLLGNPVAGVLARARGALDAGDLAGAVAAVSSLSGPPAAAMDGWLADARALLAARAGLAEMAARA